MTNINLSQSTQGVEGGQKKSKPVDKGLRISLAILVVTLLIFGGLKLWSTLIASKQESVNEQINKEAKSLEGEDVDRVVDIQQRMIIIGENIASKQDPNEILSNVSGSLVSGSVLTSLSATSDTVELEVTSENFFTTAKQVLSFKKSDYFKSVSISGITVGDDGKVSYALKIGL